MNKGLKTYSLLLVLFFGALVNCYSQTDEVVLGLRAGHNAVFGGFFAPSLEMNHEFCDNFSLNGGVQYNTIGKTDLEIHPTYIVDFDWGKIKADAMIAYRNFTSINSFAIGAGAKAHFKWFRAKLGYYYHLFGSQEYKITEPFNIYYEFCADLLNRIENWDLKLILTNCEIFELERHYQPSYIAECFHNIGQNFGVSIGVGYKPTGTFNISADYYQSFIKTGLCYRW